MESKFSQKFERNLQAHRSNLKEKGSEVESVSQIMNRAPVDRVNKNVMDIMYQILYDEKKYGLKNKIE